MAGPNAVAVLQDHDVGSGLTLLIVLDLLGAHDLTILVTFRYGNAACHEEELSVGHPVFLCISHESQRAQE